MLSHPTYKLEKKTSGFKEDCSNSREFQGYPPPNPSNPVVHQKITNLPTGANKSLHIHPIPPMFSCSFLNQSSAKRPHPPKRPFKQNH